MPHIGNNLAGLHLLASRNTDSGTMCIQGRESAAVVDFDIVPIASAPTVRSVGNGHGTIRGSQNRCALRNSDVGNAMVADLTCNRVCAVALRRGDRSLHRQRPLQGSVRKHRIHTGSHEFPTPLHKAS